MPVVGTITRPTYPGTPLKRASVGQLAIATRQASFARILSRVQFAEEEGPAQHTKHY